MLFKTLNFTNKNKQKGSWGAGSAQLIKSLKHSLRIPSKKSKDKIEWMEDQSGKNLIWTPINGLQKLNELSQKERASLASAVVKGAREPVKSNDDRTELSKLRSKLKNKVKNASTKETDQDLIEAFQNILNVKGVVDIGTLITNLDQFEFQRKNQKTKSARDFLECHNKIERLGKQEISKTQATVQEAFFKFPSANTVTGIEPNQRMEALKSFYEKYFGDYPIHFVVMHGDEEPDGKDYADHPHIFISTKNKASGQYDLFNSQIKLVNRYLAKIHPNVEPISDKPDFAEARVMYGYLQDIFYLHINNKLLKTLDFKAEKLEKTEEHMEKLRNIRKDQRKPKEERQFNLYELAKKRTAEEELKAFNALKKKQKDLSLIKVEISEAQGELEHLNNKLPTLRSENETRQRKSDELLQSAQDYDVILNAIEEITPKYEKIVDDYKSIINNVKKQIHDGLRQFYSVMWGLEAWGKDKLKFSIFKKKMDGAPEDLKEFDERIDRLVRIATDETIDTFLDLDFAIPKKPIPQAFKQKVKELRADPARSERSVYMGKGVNLNEEPIKVVTQSKATVAYAPESEKFFDNKDREKKIEEAIERAKGKPKV